MKQTYLAYLRLFGLFVVLVFITSCVENSNTTTIDPLSRATPTFSMTPTIQVTSPTASAIAMSTATKPVWESMQNKPSANQVRAMLIDQSGELWTGGPGGLVHWNRDMNKLTIYAIRDSPENTNVVGLSRTSDGTIWAGTFGNGLAKFDGANWQSFTLGDGLPGNYVISQTVSSVGDLWLTTQKNKQSMEDGHFGRLDGNKWVTEAGGVFSQIVALPNRSIVGVFNYPYGGSSFMSKISIYDGKMWSDTGVVPDGWVDAITVAPDGVIWFATLKTVYRYADQTWTKITPPWTGKDFPQVSSIAVSPDGVAWFGFSLSRFDIDRCGGRYSDFEEKGVYRYDGKTWTHFTTKDGLIDNKICVVTLDSSGNAWFGSFDKGVSHFDGHNWTSYVIP